MVANVLTQSKIAEIIAIAEVSPVAQSGGNSTIKRVNFGSRDYAVKDYSGRANGRERLSQEFSALALVHPALPAHFPEPLGVSGEGVQAIHSWINGVRPDLNLHTVDHMLDLASKLHDLSARVPVGDALPATDQVLTIDDIIDQIHTRADALATGPNEVAEFTRTQLRPRLQQLPKLGSAAGPAVLTLSLSDFGAHNMLWDEGERVMRCTDLEFFGWDDAHKLIADALLHPLADWTTPTADAFLTGAFNVYQLKEERLLGMWPYLSLKWATITLARAARNLGSSALAPDTEAMQRAHTYASNASKSPSALSDIVGQVAGTQSW